MTDPQGSQDRAEQPDPVEEPDTLGEAQSRGGRPLAHGDDEREDLAAGERQYTSADLTAHDSERGEVDGTPD